ncbi:hypothetical protein MSAS_33530 [Mycobacterium saskatchewanense]|nr:hypothetical protein MSAS_33530 [Mycobacterium saskatchewanense]
MLLEGPHRLVEIGVEQFGGYVLPGRQVLVGAFQHSQRGERCPDFGHSSAAVTTAQRVAVFTARTRHTKGLRDKLTNRHSGAS